VPVADATSLSFSNGTIAPNSTCTISVSVTADTAADYPNTTGNLFINTSVDTGNSSSDTLKVSSASACLPGQTLVAWTFPLGSSPTAPAFTAGTKAANVVTALASTTTSSPAIETNTSYGNPAPSWSGQGFTGGAYFQFQVDTSKYTNVTISFDHIQTTASWNTVSTVTVASSTDGSTFTCERLGDFVLHHGFLHIQYDREFHIFQDLRDRRAKHQLPLCDRQCDLYGLSGPGPRANLDQILRTGPDRQRRRFHADLYHHQYRAGNVAQTGIAFTDVLPEGLAVSDGTTSACNGTNNLITTASTRTISLTGGSLPAGGNCTFNVPVTGVEEGAYENITDFLILERKRHIHQLRHRYPDGHLAARIRQILLTDLHPDWRDVNPPVRDLQSQSIHNIDRHWLH
jgi:hypothetical protein